MDVPGTPPLVRRSLRQILVLVPVSTASKNRCCLYIYFGNPSNVPYIGSNFDNTVGSVTGLVYPFEYQTMYKWYSRMTYLGLKYRATWYRDIFNTTGLVTSTCSVDYTDQGPQNAAVSTFAFDNANRSRAICSTSRKYKFARAVPTNAVTSVQVSISGKITSNQVWRQDVRQLDRWRVPTVVPGAANNTASQLNNGVGTAAVGCVAFIQEFPDLVAPTSQGWSTLYLELDHDILFFDVRPVPIPPTTFL